MIKVTVQTFSTATRKKSEINIRVSDLYLLYVPIPRHKSRLSHMNVFICHYGGQFKTAVKQKAGEKIDWKR